MGNVGTLKAIFGEKIPSNTDVALRTLTESPLAPADPGELAALREAVIAHAGEQVAQLAAAGTKVAESQGSAGQRRSVDGMLELLASRKSASAGAVNAAPKLARAVSVEQAQALFDTLAAAPDIPHDFVDDGCMFRAHVMAKRLEEAGVYSEKIIRSPVGGDLRINSSKAALGFTLAMFHIAPVIYVRTAQGKIERRVIDPSLCKGPATEAEWASHMETVGGGPCTTSYASRFVLMPYDKDNPPDHWKADDLEDALAWNTQYKEVEKAMKESGFYEHLQELVDHPPGS